MKKYRIVLHWIGQKTHPSLNEMRNTREDVDAELPPSTVPCSQTSIDGSVVKDTEADLTKSAEITYMIS